MQTVPPSYLRAAKSLGATNWTAFWRRVFPAIGARHRGGGRFSCYPVDRLFTSRPKLLAAPTGTLFFPIFPPGKKKTGLPTTSQLAELGLRGRTRGDPVGGGARAFTGPTTKIVGIDNVKLERETNVRALTPISRKPVSFYCTVDRCSPVPFAASSSVPPKQRFTGIVIGR